MIKKTLKLTLTITVLAVTLKSQPALSNMPSDKTFREGQTYHVYPLEYQGNKQEPAFTGLNEAYYGGGNLGDWWLVPEPRVELPNINDFFNGSAPDLEAWESGAAIPHYGPREKQ